MSVKPNHIPNAGSLDESSNEGRSVNDAPAFPNRTFEKTTGAIVIINAHSIILDCLAQAIRIDVAQPVVGVPTIDELIAEGQLEGASLVVLCQLGLSRGEAIRQVEQLCDYVKDCPTVVLSDKEDPDLVVEVLEKRVRGYIPTSLPLGVAIQAMRLVHAGGVYVPASSLFAAHHSPRETMRNRFGSGMFTTRQSAVVEALMRGKANKIIAYELNMKESTVKVHVRNIMKKLRATNRTQVAYMANRLLNGEELAG